MTPTIKVETKECPECGVQVPKQQIETYGKCERHLTTPAETSDGGNPTDEEVEHGVSIIENKWKPKVIEEKGRGEA